MVGMGKIKVRENDPRRLPCGEHSLLGQVNPV